MAPDRLRGLRQQLVLVDRRVIGQGIGGHFRRHRAVLEHPHHILGQHPTDHGRLQAPAAEAGHQHLLAAGLHHEQHPLLGFTQQELIGGHAGFPRRHPIEIELNAEAALGGHLRTAAGEAGGAHVLGRHHITTLEGLQTGLDQPLLQKGIAHLHGGAIVEGGLGELGTGEAGAAHAIAAGGAAHINHRIAHPPGTGADDVVGFHQPQGHGIDQGVTAVTGIKGHLTAHRGHADAVAVVGDAGHHALHQADIALVLQGAEAQGIEEGDRPRPHREDVAQDAAHPSGRALERFDSGGMVVALDLEGEALPLPQIHHPGVFAWPHQDAGAGGGELTEQGPGVAVTTVLRPHHPEHAQFGPVGSAAQPAHDLLVIALTEALLAQRFRHREGG